MIKRKSKRRIRRNPYIEKELISWFETQSSDFKIFDSGMEGRVYSFSLKKALMFKNVMLYPEKYVLKIFYDNNTLDDFNINRLITLSKYGVIPKIFYIGANIIIMKYIDGESYYYFSRKSRNTEKLKMIDQKIDRLVDIWNQLGLTHGDLNEGNILITKNLKVYFIDPKIYWNYEQIEY